MKIRKKRLDDRGVSSLELVLVLPILLPILFGIVEYGWLFKHQMDLNNAVSEGVRAVVYEEGGGIYNAASAMMEVMVTDESYIPVFMKLRQTLSLTHLSDPDRAQVKLTNWQHQSLTGFFPSALLPSTLSATAVMAYP